ncbi:MAG: hypothetical protein ACRDE2_15315, partial [Chitinophagaceae bacterium]
TQGQIENNEKENDSLQKKIENYKSLMAAMTEEELKTTAYVDMQNFRYSKNELKDLVPYGRQDGWPLYKVNPDYYDNALPPYVIQSIMVTYWYHKQFCLDFLRKRTKEIFDQIDYHALKESMK